MLAQNNYYSTEAIISFRLRAVLFWGSRYMKKPDLLVFLTIIVALGAAVTGMTAEHKRPAHVIAAESSIR
jgi:hypothetical protein